MSTLRITNIEAKADPSSPTVDEKIKLTNSNGDILVHIDGKTSGITTIGINTTAGNIKFDQNSNVVVTGIITATKFVGTIEPTSLEIGSNIKLGNAGVITATSYVGDGSALTGIDATQIQTGNTSVQTVDTGSNGHVKINTEGTERLRITSAGTLESYSPDDTTPNIKWRSNDTNWFGALNQSVEGGTITSFLSCGGDWSANGTTYSATKALAAYPTSAIAIHNQYNSSWGSQFVFLTKAGGSTTTDGAVTERLRITSDGKVRVPDNGKFTAGAGDDLQIYHDGSHSYVLDNGTGDLRLASNSITRITKGDSETCAAFNVDGASELYHDNSKKFETKSDGVVVTGGIYLDGSGGTGSANKLDDYEEGTWSPNVGGNASYDIQWGYYVKVGSLVHCWGGLRTQTLGTGNARVINNLPFTAVASPSSTQTGGGSVVWHDNAPNNIINTPAIAVTPNTTNSFINAKTSGSGALQDHVDFWQNNHRANFFITYYTTV